MSRYNVVIPDFIIKELGSALPVLEKSPHNRLVLVIDHDREEDTLEIQYVELQRKQPPVNAVVKIVNNDHSIAVDEMYINRIGIVKENYADGTTSVDVGDWVLELWPSELEIIRL